METLEFERARQVLGQFFSSFDRVQVEREKRRFSGGINERAPSEIEESPGFFESKISTVARIVLKSLSNAGSMHR